MSANPPVNTMPAFSPPIYYPRPNTVLPLTKPVLKLGTAPKPATKQFQSRNPRFHIVGAKIKIEGVVCKVVQVGPTDMVTLRRMITYIKI